MSRLQKWSLALLLGLALLVITLLFLLCTQPGLHWLISTGVRWIDGLKIEHVEGDWHDLHLKGIHYVQPGINLDIKKIDLSLEPACLLHSMLCVNSIKSDALQLKINTTKLPHNHKASTPISDISIPYPIKLAVLQLTNTQVQIDNNTVTLQKFHSGAVWQQRRLTLEPTTINGLHVNFPPTVLSREEQQQKDRQKYQEPSRGQTLTTLFSHPVLANLTDFRFPLDVIAPHITGSNWSFSGDDEFDISQFLLNASVDKDTVQLHTLNVTSSEGTLSLQGKLGTDQQWPITSNATLHIPISGGGEQTLNITAGGALKQILQLNAQATGSMSAKLTAQLQLADAGIPIDIHLTSPALNWPLEGETQYQIKNVNARLTGKMTKYRIGLSGNLRGLDLADSPLTLQGEGTAEQVKLTQLRLSTLQGHIDLTGAVDWSKAMSWHALLTLNNINTAKQWPDWPAQLQGKIITRGSFYGGNWQLAIPELNVTGNVKKKAVNLKGAIRGNEAGQWEISDLNLRLGENRLAMQGTLGKEWRLDTVINAPNLAGFLPGLAGTAQGYIKLRGKRDLPQVLSDLSASEIRWQSYGIGKLNFISNISALKPNGHLSLEATALNFDTVNIKAVQLALKGNEQKHQLDLILQGKPVSAILHVNGGFNRQKEDWTGIVRELNVTTPMGIWQINKAVPISYFVKQDKVNIAAHCWVSEQGKVCAPEPIILGSNVRAKLLLQRINLAIFNTFLHNNTQLQGELNGQTTIQWHMGKALPDVQLKLVGNDIKIEQRMAEDSLPLSIKMATLQANLNKDRGNMVWLLEMADSGKLSGDLHISDPEKQRILSGQLKVDTFSLGMLQPLLHGEQVKGILNSHIRLLGTLKQPKLFGDVLFTNIALIGNLLPIDVIDGDMQLKLSGTQSLMEGKLVTRQGKLNLNGKASWRDIEHWQTQLSAKGNNVRVTLPPMIQLDVSPDITLEATPKGLNLDGKIDVPWARIVVKSLPENAVMISPDEVMLDTQLQPMSPPVNTIPIRSRLRVNVGNDVKLDAFGLKAKLEGELRVLQDNKKGLGINGRINLPSGDFRAYGQELIIKKGTLLFSGPPEQPMLNVEAIRDPESTEDNVIVGVRITGSADTPQLQLFSEPAMSQQEMLSYLLRGQKLGADGDSGDMMTSMLIGLGLSKSGKLIGEIGEAFGVQGFSLDTKGAGDSSQVEVSGYLLPGLQVKYGVGIFDSLATLTLRYRLMPRLYLEAISGIDQTLDLLYQFEF